MKLVASPFAAFVAEGEPLPPDDRIVRAGASELSLEAIYHAHAPRLLRYFARKASRQEAGDLVQESFVRLASAAIEPDRPEAYLQGIAANLLRSRARSALQRTLAHPDPAALSPAVASDFSKQLEARDMLNRLQTAMLRLSPKTREIFMAHRLDGASYAEIAERTGLSVKGVEWHMSKAIAHLRRTASAK